MNGATVTVKKLDGTNCGTTTTTATGSYSLVTACVGDLVVEVTGGSYLDEATQVVKQLGSPLKVVVAANGGTQTAAVTPLTTLAFNSNFGGTPTSAAAYQAQVQKVAAYFGMQGVDLVKRIPDVSSSTDVYGKYLQAVSKFLNGQDVSTFLQTDLANNTSFQTAFNAAMNAIGGITVSFDASVLAAAPNTGGGSTGGGATGGTGTLTVSGTAMGVSIPGVTIANVPVPGNQDEFCGELSSDSTLKSFETAGAKFVVSSCSFSNKVGTVVATLQMTTPIAINAPYNLTYTYR